jgi:hypothetical protein
VITVIIGLLPQEAFVVCGAKTAHLKPLKQSQPRNALLEHSKLLQLLRYKHAARNA